MGMISSRTESGADEATLTPQLGRPVSSPCVGELYQRFANRAAADAKAFGKLDLREPGARFEAAGEDIFAELVGNLFPEAANQAACCHKGSPGNRMPAGR